MSFVKLDSGLLDSTLWTARPQLEIFLTALLKARPRQFESDVEELHPDRIEPTGFVVPAGSYGFVASSGPGIVRLALACGVDSERFGEGLIALATLAMPEPESRTAAFGGRRMIRIDGGYIVLNYMRYRDHDGNAAIRMRMHRARQRQANVTDFVPYSSLIVTEAEEIAEEEAIKDSTLQVEAKRLVSNHDENKVFREKRRATEVPIKAIVALYHELLPALPRVEKLTQVRLGLIRQRHIEDLETLAGWSRYFEDVARSSFLMGRAPPTNGRPPFKANLEWLCRPSNFAKVAEGNFRHAQ